jgi:hypothetical protein
VTSPAAAEPVFDRVAGPPALYALSSRGEAAAPGYWAGYRPSRTLPLTPSLTLDTAWRDPGGVYLFCGRTPADAVAFQVALDELLGRISPGGAVRMLWLDDPNAAAADWTPATLLATATGQGAGIRWTVSQPARFAAGDHAVVVRNSAGMALAGGATAAVRLAGADIMSLSAPGGDYPSVDGSVSLPLTGRGVGAWAAQLSLNRSTDKPLALAGLESQFRYSIADPQELDPGAPGPGTRTVRMPLLRPYTGEVIGPMTFDPVNIRVPDRTAIGLGLTGRPKPVLGSYLRSPLGHPLTLTPAADGSPWPARLVFNLAVPGGSAGPPCYLTLDGAFELASPAGDPRLAFGLSGLEYADFRGRPATCRFVAGQPAFADAAGELTDAATTAYLDLLPGQAGGPSLIYCAQSDLAPWYSAASPDASGFLAPIELPAATLPGWPTAAPGPGVPAGCYESVDPAELDAAGWLDAAVLAPARRAAIGGGAPAMAVAVRAVTPQGMLATADANRAGWNELQVGSFPGARIPDLAFTDVSAELRGALQASELCMVIADPAELLRNASVRYRLTPKELDLLRAADVPEVIVSELNRQLGPNFPTFANETAFTARVGPIAGTYLPDVLEVAGQLRVTLDDWTFQLSPRSWRVREHSPDSFTIMLVKFSGRPVADLAADPAAWTWPKAAGDPAVTSGLLAGMVKEAAAAPPDSPDGRFYAGVLADPRWTGVLFLNAPVVTGELPDELRFVTAGIDTGNFYAQHIALTRTPVELIPGGHVSLGRTDASGLIRYVDATELAPERTVPFAFVTQRLEVAFAGGTISELDAQVQLVVNELFGSRLTRLDPVGGNSLTLTGAYQWQDGVPGYRFALDRTAVYATDGAALESVEVLGAAVRTVAVDGQQDRVAVEFGLGGKLRFTELPFFDLFSYGPQLGVAGDDGPLTDGYLRFDDLTVTMSFPAARPKEQDFTVDEGRLSIDLAGSQPRPGSLAAAFPVRVTGVVAVPAQAGESDGQRPEDLGFAPVLAPVEQVPLRPPWYGLAMRLDLGSLGQLADSAGLTVTLLAGWMPGTDPDNPPVYCGLRLATAGATDLNLPVQGVLRLGFRGFEFIVDRSGQTPSYLLKLQRLALSVLGWSFPPGQSDVLVFGNPESSDATTVGWYAAYTSPDGSSQAGQESQK